MPKPILQYTLMRTAKQSIVAFLSIYIAPALYKQTIYIPAAQLVLSDGLAFTRYHATRFNL